MSRIAGLAHYDTFNGGASLADHIGETGADWASVAANQQSPAYLSNILINGGACMWAGAGEIFPSVLPASNAYYIDVFFKCGDTGNHALAVSVSANGATTSDSYTLSLNRTFPLATADITLTVGSITVIAIETVTPGTDLHKLRLEVKGRIKKCYYDDALIYTLDDSHYAVAGVPHWSGFSPFGASDSKVLKFLKTEIGYLPVPAPLNPLALGRADYLDALTKTV